MKNNIFTLLCFILFISGLRAQAPSQSNAVMLQGFFWDSNNTTSWSQLYQISGELSGNFDIVWLPPSAFSSGGTGYMPKQWSNQNSAWGTKTELTRLINSLKSNGCRAMADIVVNHRDGKTSWMDFYTDDFGSYGSFTFGREHICYNDEAQYSSSVPANQKPSGTNDTGENFDGARDLDHTNTYVQNAVKAYLKWMKNEMSFDGWRYDMVKGFSGSYINGYNAAGGAYLSVGEYWDGNYDAVWNWINATGKTSTAFDFPMKYAALNNGLAQNNYGAMTWKDGSTSRPAGLIHGSQSRRYAVTFVDNHDTYRDGSKYTGDVLKAYAFILSSPGIPCVFYPHWTANKATINSMISARKAVGLHSESNVEVQNTSGYYKAYSVGTCGEMLTYIGSWSEDPTKSGYTRACYGSGWAMYTKVTSTSCGNEHQQGIDNGQNPNQGTKFTSITITATVPAAWTAPKIHVWNKGVAGAPQITKAAWPGDAMTSLGNNTWTITLSGFAETNEVGIVFNDGKASGAAQTIDLSTNKTPTCWILSATASTGGKFDATEDPNCGTLATGISDVEQENRIVLYPNPVENELRLFTGQSLVFAEIRTLSGQAIKSSTEKQIQVADLKAGMYLLMVYTTDGSVQTLKFIKK